MPDEIRPGLTGEIAFTVAEEHSAPHIGSGGVQVLATPTMIAFMEQASDEAVDHLLPEDQITVGIHVDVRHLAATPVGMEVTIRSELVEVDGRRLTFRVEGYDEQEKIGEGTHRRMIIDVGRFMERLEAKQSGAQTVEP